MKKAAPKYNQTIKFCSIVSLFLMTGLTSISYGKPLTKAAAIVDSSVIPANYFGMHINNASKIPWPTVPFGSWRLWDANVTWSKLEPVKGQWNFQLLDQYADLAKTHNVNLCYVLGQTPTWASSQPDLKTAANYGLGASVPPSDIEDWKNYVRTIASRYNNRISCFEIWNEPNLALFYQGTPEDLVPLGREAYKIIKEVNPKNVILSPSIVRTNGVVWLDKYFAAGGKDFFDVVSIHSYENPPELSLEVVIDPVKQLIKKYNLSKSIWMTEQGGGQGRKFDDGGVAYVGRSYVLNWNAGIKRYYWYMWDNTWWVSIFMVDVNDPGRSTTLPAAKAYQEVYRWLIGAKMLPCVVNIEKTWVCSITKAGGYSGRIVWNPDKTSSYTVPTINKFQRYSDLYGQSFVLPLDGRLAIGPSPLLIDTKATP
jgi:hypothetical protein